jgi:translocator protein
LAQALMICLGGAGLESLAAGSGPRAYLATLVLPRRSPSFGGWIVVGLVYYTVCAILLYRLIARGLGTPGVAAAVILLLVLMVANAFWNYLFFRKRSPRASYVLFYPYVLVALLLLVVLFFVDRPGAWVFLPYAGYLVYALLWSRRVWHLNRDAPLRHATVPSHGS